MGNSHIEIIITREQIILTDHYNYFISRLSRHNGIITHSHSGIAFENAVCKILIILFRPQCFNSPCRMLHLRFQIKNDNGCQKLLMATNHVTQRREINRNRPNPDVSDSYMMSPFSLYFRDFGQFQQYIINHDAFMICILMNEFPIIIKIIRALHANRILPPSGLMRHIYNNEFDHHCFW